MGLGKAIRDFKVNVSLGFDKKKVDDAKKSIEEMGAGLKSIGVQVALASAALLGLAENAGRHSRSLQNNSAQLGINVEKLQELEYAAKIAAGVSREELTGSLEGLSKTLFEARNNNVEAARTLIRLGVPFEMIANKSATADQVLLSLSETFKSMPDGMMKTALANEALGGSGAKLLPLLNKGAVGIANMGVEARKLGVIIGKDVVASGAEFDRQLSKMWFVIKNITYLVGNQMIKYMGGLVEQFQKFIVQNRKFIATGIAVVMKSLGTYLQIVFKVVSFLAQRFKYLVDVMGGLEKVTKTLGVAFGVFTGLRLIASLGTLIKSFRAVASVMSLMSIQSLLIGAAFGAIILVVQDLFSNDSIIKEWIKTFAQEFPNAMKFVTGAFDLVKAAINDAIGAFQTVYGWIMKGMDAIMSFGVAANAAFAFTDKLKSLGSFLGKGLGIAGDYMSSVAGAGPKPSAAAVTNNANNNTDQSKQNMNATVNVNVGAGASAKQATEATSQGVMDAFHNMMRSTRNQSIGGVAF